MNIRDLNVIFIFLSYGMCTFLFIEKGWFSKAQDNVQWQVREALLLGAAPTDTFLLWSRITASSGQRHPWTRCTFFATTRNAFFVAHAGWQAEFASHFRIDAVLVNEFGSVACFKVHLFHRSGERVTRWSDHKRAQQRHPVAPCGTDRFRIQDCRLFVVRFGQISHSEGEKKACEIVRTLIRTWET